MKVRSLSVHILLAAVIILSVCACSKQAVRTNSSKSTSVVSSNSLSSSIISIASSSNSERDISSESAVKSQSSSKTSVNSTKNTQASGNNSNNANSASSWSPKPEVQNGSNLHLTGNDYPIGDVHPFYDARTGKWYLFHLREKNGVYSPLLYTSEDMLHWTSQTIRFDGTPLQSYYVLGVLNTQGKYYSYFGNGMSVQSSVSSDLINWSYSRGTNLWINSTYPAGARDPYVFLDSDKNVFRCVSTTYRTNQNMKVGSGMDVSIAMSSTADNTLTTWTSEQKDILRFPNGYNGEPECSQMNKIGNRWYVSASMLRRSNQVGFLTYWIGDTNKCITDVDWQSKPENSLDSDDLCAPQIVEANGKNYMWGWIPKGANGGWGGHVCLPREVYALPDGKLASKLEGKIGEKIRGRKLEQYGSTQLSQGKNLMFSGRYSRLDLDIQAQMNSDTLNVTIGNTSVKIDKLNGKIICSSGSIVYAAAKLAENIASKANIRVIAEGNIVEVFVNDQTSFCARVSDTFNNAAVTVSSSNTTIESAALYRLRFIEEI